MIKTLLGTNEDGSPHYLYKAESDTEVLIRTGPAVALLTMADGTVYDVTDPYVGLEGDHPHVAELTHALGDWYEANGHPDHDKDTPFVHDRDATNEALAAAHELHAAAKTKLTKGSA